MGFAEYHIVWGKCAHPNCKSSCQGLLNRPALLLHPCFVEASLTVEKVVVVLKNELTRSLVANDQCLQYTNFILQARNEATDRCVQNYVAGCHGP